MNLSDIPYPQRLVTEMLHYSVWSCDKTSRMKYSELRSHLEVFFTTEQIQQAQDFLEGKSTNTSK
jgi:hypothetical protein